MIKPLLFYGYFVVVETLSVFKITAGWKSVSLSLHVSGVVGSNQRFSFIRNRDPQPLLGFGI